MPRPPRSRHFGSLPDGRSVEAWTLVGDGGLELEIVTYGGIVTRLLASDRHGHQADVVLGFDHLAPYLAGHPYFGATVGRVAGRITGARFNLDGRTYPLAANHARNHLHGGLVGFDKRLWSAEPVNRPDGAPSLRLTLHSPDGEEGYPGNLAVAVTYTVTADDTFLFETEVTTDRATPVSLTHHGYFNLSGESSAPALDHTLQLYADTYAPTDDSLGLIGRLEPVTAANNFRSPRRLRDAIPGLFLQHGDNYFVSRAPSSPPLRPAAVLADPASGRVLTVSTTNDCLQFYTGAFLDGSLTGKSGRPYAAHAGLCLECQGYPDALNTPALGDILVHPGRPQRHATAYAFSTF